MADFFSEIKDLPSSNFSEICHTAGALTAGALHSAAMLTVVNVGCKMWGVGGVMSTAGLGVVGPYVLPTIADWTPAICVKGAKLMLGWVNPAIGDAIESGFNYFKVNGNVYAEVVAEHKTIALTLGMLEALCPGTIIISALEATLLAKMTCTYAIKMHKLDHTINTTLEIIDAREAPTIRDGYVKVAADDGDEYFDADDGLTLCIVQAQEQTVEPDAPLGDYQLLPLSNELVFEELND